MAVKESNAAVGVEILNRKPQETRVKCILDGRCQFNTGKTQNFSYRLELVVGSSSIRVSSGNSEILKKIIKQQTDLTV